MNDLELVRELRAEVQVPETTRLADGRARLLTAAGSKQPRRSVLLPAAAAAVAVAVVAGGVGYGLSTRGPAGHGAEAGHTTTAPPASKAPAESAAGEAVLAAWVLLKASDTVGRAAVAAEPAPGQWIYSKTVRYEYPQGNSSDEEWITFDGTMSAYRQGPGGPLIVHTSPATPPASSGDPLADFNAQVTPKTAYDALASLPAHPRALLDAVRKAADAMGAENLAAGTPVAGRTPKNEGQLEFDYLSLLLWNAAGGVGAPAVAEAAAYRAMATIPGVSVQQGITDAAGAPAIGVSADGGYDQLLLDQHSYQVIGLRQLSTGIGPSPAIVASPQQPAKPQAAPRWPHEGSVIQSLAYARVSEVSGPGIR